MADQTTPAPSLADRLMPALAERPGMSITVLTPEARAIAAVSRLGAQMRIEAENAATHTNDDNER